MGEYAELDLRIFWSIEGGVKVEVGEVCCNKLGPRSEESAVDDQLDSFKGPRLGFTIAGV